MKPKEETDVLLITTRCFFKQVYIFRKFHPCTEKSPIFANTNRVTETVVLKNTVLPTLQGRYIALPISSHNRSTWQRRSSGKQRSANAPYDAISARLNFCSVNKKTGHQKSGWSVLAIVTMTLHF